MLLESCCFTEEPIVSSSASMFLVVSLNQEKEEIVCQLQYMYWNSFVDNCCSSAVTLQYPCKATVNKPENFFFGLADFRFLPYSVKLLPLIVASLHQVMWPH